ncbi:tetratricopeptide repeat protein [Phormidium sp. CLA17]|uniref:tetratricopeptide repeat protein n=1 Tax=Leptolyngbya sp. Cla-17 TaxID=2803751 RepID=UPI001491513B|nr:tetratricopeptide repeat protein [Leptolyngbya sp. Cla-17]MBM0742721.1 tetratricopeptide repeat protein [Leptolyngbya sp. Cla-17]
MTPKEEVYQKLRQWQKALSLNDSDTGLINTVPSVSRLQPKARQNDLKLYEQLLERMLAEARDRQSSLQARDRHELQALQQVLHLADEDVAEIEHRLTTQSAQSAETVLPTVSPKSGSDSLTSPPLSSFNSSTQSPSTEIPSTEIPPTHIPSAQVPSAQVPSAQVPSTIPPTQIPPTQIPSAEIPSSASGEVNYPANLTGVKGQVVKRKMEMDAANTSVNPSPVDQSTPQKAVSQTVTEIAPPAAVPAVQLTESAPASSTSASAQVVFTEPPPKVQRDRRPLLITLGLLLPLLGIIGGIWLALRSNLGRNTVPTDPKVALQFIVSGTKKNQQRQYAAAIQDFNQAIRFNEQDATAYLNRGFAHHQMGQLNEAVEDYDKALTFNNKFAEAYSNRSHVRFDQGRQDAALEDASRAIALQPKLAVAHLNMGNALLAKGNLDGAFQKFSQTLQLKPSNIVAARAHNNQGNVFAGQKKIDEAIGAYTQAIQLDDTYADAFYNRAIAFERKGNRQGAINDFREADSRYEAAGNKEMSNRAKRRIEQSQKNSTPMPPAQSPPTQSI